ncbi:tetratricopeptide repeat protein [Solitalea lacus]|uniref:type IX secretion system periplasmic lipoprotein PorW/SprE n=1 Tax=Solitalea lacus TaxID=2911172 RepID=UPI001EDC1F8C|nr:tetratricopeptide repeat protein [Solitalea lacus]UKJ07339.1 tetratricopeptide repeat protein [Solitalea lacus]
MLLAAGACKMRDPLGNRIGVVKGTYHNTTAKFNAYFNAKEIFRKDVTNFENSYSFSYSNILPLLKLPDESAAASMATNMDQVIEKCSKVIANHKASKWTDDAYLMVGKSYFYKGDFFNAAQTFQYIYNTFPNRDLKVEALAWVGLSKMQDKLTADAVTAFEMAEANLADAKKSEKFVLSAIAQFNINQKNYEKAANILERTVRSLKNEKPARAYFYYVLGQVLEKNEKYAEATNAFKQVQGLGITYELELAAKINAFKLTNLSEGGNTDDLVRKLNDLLKDDKNADYKDQIYFVLGAIAQRKNQIDSAVTLFSKSATNSDKNLNQKALSYSQIANIYFNKKDYDKARLYYDSTRTFVQRDLPDYDKIIQRSTKLNELIADIRTIDREDSLQRVASMPEAERNKIIDQQVTKIQNRIRESKLQENQFSTYYNTQAINRFDNTEGTGSTWYFYNHNAIAAGYNEFIRRWGNRQLEDNWRISSSQTFANNKLFDNDPAFDLEKMDPAQPEKIKSRLLGTLPLTPAKLDSSNLLKQQAALKLAAIYDNDLEEYNNAIKYYELAVNNPMELRNTDEVLYNLHRLYGLNGNNIKADAIKNRLINEYPASSYTAALRNPGATLAHTATQKQAEELYETAYTDFQNHEYEKVIEAHKKFQGAEANSSLKSQFALLATMAVGHTQKPQQFEAELRKVEAAFPNENAGKQAGMFIASIEKNRTEFETRTLALEGTSYATTTNAAIISKRFEEEKRNEEEQRKREEELAEAKSYFKKATPEAKYVLVVSVNNANANLNRIRLGIGQFNRSLFADKNYLHSSKTINNETQLISVSQFNDLETAKGYFRKFMDYRSDVVGLPDDKYNVFIITTDNFARLINQQTVEDYRNYFRINF